MLFEKDYIKQMFDFIEYYAQKFNINFVGNNRYYLTIKEIERICENSIEMSVKERKAIERFLISLEIPNLKFNIFKICNPDIPLDENTKNIEHYDLMCLSDSELLGYLMHVFSTINFNEHEDLVQLKYNIVIWDTGFHNIAKYCRGKIINATTKEIVSYPFDKFFNINEVPETKQERIQEMLNNAKYLYVTDKKDGSTIIITKFGNRILVTTNGSFENEQIMWAKEIIEEKYSTFWNDMQEGYTYIFELIHPLNRIVIDYGDEKDLYLLAVRDLSTSKLLSLDETHKIANEFSFPYPDVYSFNDLDEIVELAHNARGANKEGWVLRIGLPDGNEQMLKIKLDEYFEIHSAFDKVKLSFVYKHLFEETLDDFMSIANDEQKKKVHEKLAIIDNIRETIKEESIVLANNFLKKHKLTLATFGLNHESMVVCINDLLSSKNPFKHFALTYMKNALNLERQIRAIKPIHMKNFAKMFGFNFNE